MLCFSCNTSSDGGQLRRQPVTDPELISPVATLRLELWRTSPYIPARQGTGRPRLAQAGRGKSGLHGTTVPGNARPVPAKAGIEGQCHRKHTARLRSGKVERVRQERTARPATGAAR